MDESSVRRVLAGYCPPLSSAQVDAIAFKVAEASAKEISKLSAQAEATKAARKSRKSKSQE
ncbi:MAG TPA: hypothetical protein ENN36_03185 [Candidatus Bathyarchaeota archaeon]|nr:hypothetical protein [Candidatus Bathyarchaeota archaeon]